MDEQGKPRRARSRRTAGVAATSPAQEPSQGYDTPGSTEQMPGGAGGSGGSGGWNGSDGSGESGGGNGSDGSGESGGGNGSDGSGGGNGSDGSCGSDTPDPSGMKPVVVIIRRGRARASFELFNQGSERLEPARAELEGVRFFTRKGEPVGHLPLRGGIAPGQRGELWLSLNIDPATPAGCYRGVGRVGDLPVPLTFVVPEERIIQLTPKRLTVEAQPGEVIERCLAIENRGNVPVTLYSPLPAPLEIRDKLHDLVRRAVQQTHTDDYHALLNSFVARARETVASDLNRLLVPTLVEAPRVLVPGETAVVTLRWRMPGGLERGQRYRAALGLAGSSLVVEVLRPRTLEPSPTLNPAQVKG